MSTSSQHSIQQGDRPLVSVITPCLNPGDRLERCIDSIERQTHPYVEHIIVDGGSTDGTLELLKEHRRVRWISEPDRGQSDAINKGFRMATGQLMGWLNADDVLAPRAAELAAEAMADGDIGWIAGRVELVDGGKRKSLVPPEAISLDLFTVSNPVPQPGSFVASWALDQVGLLDESLHLAMDVDLWVRLIDANIGFKAIPEVVATFEVHADSKTGSLDASAFLIEEARVYLKHRHFTQARAVTNRLYLRDVSLRVGAALRDHDHATARALSRDALTAIGPLFGRSRAKFLLISWFPRLAAALRPSMLQR